MIDNIGNFLSLNFAPERLQSLIHPQRVTKGRSTGLANDVMILLFFEGGAAPDMTRMTFQGLDTLTGLAPDIECLIKRAGENVVALLRAAASENGAAVNWIRMTFER